MTTIKASCPTCGEVELLSAHILVTVCSYAPWSYYAFCCPGCAVEVRKPADDHVVSLLKSGGVEVEVWEIPTEALEPHTGLAITGNEVADFILDLEDEDPFVELERPRLDSNQQPPI